MSDMLVEKPYRTVPEQVGADRSGPRLLVVDDDERRGDEVAEELGRYGYEVDCALSGRSVIDGPMKADLVLLRWGLGELHSVEVCRCVRASSSNVGIIAVGGSDSELERVLSLQAGADDHLTIPFGFHELCARIAAVLRRVVPAEQGDDAAHDEVGLGSLNIDRSTRVVTVEGHEVELTRKEFDLLWMLASRPDEVVTRQELMIEVWDDGSGVATRTIDTHMSTLRGKLGQDVPIVTVRGVGFRLPAA